MILLVIRNELIPQSKASKRNEDMTIIIYKTFNPHVTLPQFINRNFTDGAPLLLENKSMRKKNPISLRFMTDEPPMITMGIFSWQVPPFKERRGSLGNCKLKKYVVNKLSNFTYCYMNYCYVQIEYMEMFIRELVLIHIDITTLMLYVFNCFEQTKIYVRIFDRGTLNTFWRLGDACYCPRTMVLDWKQKYKHVARYLYINIYCHLTWLCKWCYRMHCPQLTVSSSYAYKTNKSNLCLYLHSVAKYTLEKYIYFAKNQAELQISITCVYIALCIEP